MQVHDRLCTDVKLFALMSVHWYIAVCCMCGKTCALCMCIWKRVLCLSTQWAVHKQECAEKISSQST